MIQSKAELEDWYGTGDPWGYVHDPEDTKRKDILLNEIPDQAFQHVLDIGCGNGFITQSLPGEMIHGIDISGNAIAHANRNNQNPKITYEEKDIFELYHTTQQFDLIVITGVLYSQYIGESSNLIFIIIDRLLQKGGILVAVHIDEWYTCRFPYNLFKENVYPYKSYFHRLEVYQK